MSDFSTTAVRFASQPSFGVMQTNPVFRQVRITDESLDGTTKTVQNDELRTDLQRTGLTPVGEEGGGSISYNLSYDNLHDPLRGVMGANYQLYPVREKTAASAAVASVGATGYTVVASAGTEINTGTPVPGMLFMASGFVNAINNGLKSAGPGTTTTLWNVGSLTTETAPVGAKLQVVGYEATSGDIVATAAGGGYAGGITSTALDFTTLALAPGDQLKLGGTATGTRFVTDACNGVVVVGLVTTNAVRFSEVPTGWAADGGSGKTIRLWLGSESLTNSVSLLPFTVEEESGDLGEFRYGIDSIFTGVTVSIPEAEKITGSATVIGSGMSTPDTVRATGATTKAPPVGEVLNGSSNIGTLRIDGVDLKGTYVTKVDISLTRAKAALRGAVGSYGKTGANLNEFGADVGLEMYYEAPTGRQLLAKVKAGTAARISTFVLDPNGPMGTRAVSFYFPRGQYTGAPRRNNSGQRVIAPSFSGSGDPVTGFTCRYQQFPYVEL